METSATSETEGAPAPQRIIELDHAIQLLSQGRMTVLGQILSSSNYAFLARVDDDELQALAVYKPRRGEVPLWDFAQGTLCVREVAAYVLSQALGWPLIPPTVLRDGSYGPGMVQLYIEADVEAHYFTFREERRADLVPVALFDIVTNNADRKGGHLLLDQDGRIWAIDHALTFHAEPKLRTVVWDFAGSAIPQAYAADLNELLAHLSEGAEFCAMLAKLLEEDEIAALRARLERLLASGTFPKPDPARRQIPWPPI